MRRTVLLGVVAVLAAGCASKEEGSTILERRKIDTTKGDTFDRPAGDRPAGADLPEEEGGKHVHVWMPLDRETHAYVDATGEIPMSALCTPSGCTKCGAVQHECQRRRRRR